MQKYEFIQYNIPLSWSARTIGTNRECISNL